MQLTREQAHTLETIKRIAHKRGVPYKHVKAAVETALVEANLGNPSYGDADSQGWRQERASLYKNPTNLKASINRFFDEAAQLDRGQGAGRLAADVQRPAEQYRGRYKERAGEASALLRGGSYGGGPVGNDAPAPAQIDPGAKRSLLLGYLAQRENPDALLDLAAGLNGLKANAQVQGKSQPTTYGKPAQTNTGKLAELFYDPAGFSSPGNDHHDHVHVATKNPKLADKLGYLAQSMGLSVRENETFDPVERVHSENSYHYRDRAIDVSGDPKKMRKFAKRVARLYGR